MALAALILAINTYSVSQKLSIIAGAVYLVALTVAGVDVYLNRRARDYTQAEIIWALFDGVNRDILESDPAATFTLFRIPPFASDSDVIVPWYRYRLGGKDAIKEAESSCARYKRGQSITGSAWDRPGRLLCEVYPKFTSVNDWRAYYKDTLRLDSALVDDLNERMMNVRTILSYGFVTSSGVLLGVLSLDLERVARLDGKHPLGRDEIRIESRTLVDLLRLIRDVLQALHKIEGVEK